MDVDKLAEAALSGQEVTTESVVAAIVLVIIGFALAWLLRRWSRRLVDGLDRQSEQLATLIVRVGQVLTVAVFTGWALTDEAVHDFARRLGEQVSPLGLRVAEQSATAGRGRMRVPGYSLRIRLAPDAGI